jgi:hypothetical protein
MVRYFTVADTVWVPLVPSLETKIATLFSNDKAIVGAAHVTVITATGSNRDLCKIRNGAISLGTHE